MDRMSALVRALNLIPYFRAHPQHSLFEAARDLGLDHRQIVADLQRLHTSGVGTHTEELIDLTFNANRTAVKITEDQGMTLPLRLTGTEAGALLLMLESLESQLIETEAVTSAAAKLRALMNERTSAIYDTAPEEADPDLVTVNEALSAGKRVAFRYFNASRAEYSLREVDPAKLYLHRGETYLTAWDPSRNGHRSFRIDRIHDARLIDEPSAPHLRELPEDPFTFDDVATVDVRADATWLADYHALTLGDEHDGWFRASLPFGSPDWLVRFALSHGDRLRIVAPEELAEEVSRRAVAGAARYDEP